MEPFRFSVGQLRVRSAGLFARLQSFSRPSASTRTRPCPFNFIETRFSDGSDGDFARHCAAVFYFGLPLGKNLNGMLVEYGIFIASDLVMLALESRFPVSFAVAGNFVQPFFLLWVADRLYVRDVDVRARIGASILVFGRGRIDAGSLQPREEYKPRLETFWPRERRFVFCRFAFRARFVSFRFIVQLGV